MNSRISGGGAAVRLDYLPIMRHLLLTPLLAGTKEGVETTVSMLDEYGLSREDFLESMAELQFTGDSPFKQKDLFKDFKGKERSAFTRAYNKGAHKSQALQQPAGKKRPAATRSSDASTRNPDEDDDAGELSESEAEDEKADAAKFSKKKTKATAAKKKGKRK